MAGDDVPIDDIVQAHYKLTEHQISKKEENPPASIHLHRSQIDKKTDCIASTHLQKLIEKNEHHKN